MQSELPNKILKLAGSKTIASEAQLVGELHAYGRPIADVAFKGVRPQTTTIASLNVGNLLLMEARTDPIIWKARPEPQLCLVIPARGSGELIERRASLAWGAGHQLLQIPYAHPVEGHTNGAHLVSVIPDIDYLRQSLSALQPGRTDIIERCLSQHAEVHSGVFNGVDYLLQINQLIAIAGMASGGGAYLDRIGLDDVLNRVIVKMLLEKEGSQMEPAPQAKSTRSWRAVDRICDHIKANIGSPMTTPQMERLTGMTGRAIDYAFQDRFGCSPHQWQRRELLAEANRRLSDIDNMQSIKTISYELGFSTAGSFSSHYKRQFGELPSQTASRRNGALTAPHRLDDYDI